ncbi:aldolase superfamily protein, partial [Striga asiatica]
GQSIIGLIASLLGLEYQKFPVFRRESLTFFFFWKEPNGQRERTALTPTASLLAWADCLVRTDRTASLAQETGKRLTRTDGRELACYRLTDLLFSLLGFFLQPAFKPRAKAPEKEIIRQDKSCDSARHQMTSSKIGLLAFPFEEIGPFTFLLDALEAFHSIALSGSKDTTRESVPLHPLSQYRA